MDLDQLLQPPAGPASEISSVVSGDDFSDRLLVSTSSPLAQQDLMGSKWGQYGVWYGHYGYYGTQYGTPAVNGRAKHNRTYCSYCCTIRSSGHAQCHSRARPVVSTEETMQSTAEYGTLPYVSGLPYTAPLPYCRLRHPCRTLPCLLCQQGLLTQWVIMVRAISSPLCLTPIGCV